MPSRHVPRDHLMRPGGRSYCGNGKSVLHYEEFLASAKRCRHCEAHCEEFPPVRQRKPQIRTVSLRPEPRVATVLDRLAAEGILGESIDLLIEWAIDYELDDRLDGDRDSVLFNFWRKG
ncbi:MAG: hypothetical protein ACRC62_01295 [Microcoleus sp.]